MEKGEALDTIWEVSDQLWERILPVILQVDPPKVTGRRRADPRQMLNGIIFSFRGRTGVAANGTICPGTWVVTAPSTALSSVG